MESAGGELHGHHHGRAVLRGQGTLICGLPCHGRAADDGQSVSSKGGPTQSVCTYVLADMQGFLQVLVGGVADQVTFADARSA